jgi:hypothetical protein
MPSAPSTARATDIAAALPPRASEPPRLRQAAFIWLCTYPTVIVHLWLLTPLIKSLPMWLGALVVTVPVALVSVFFVQPAMTRLMYGWLMSPRRRLRQSDIGVGALQPARSALAVQLLQVVNGGDRSGFLQMFAVDGAVVDWGRRFDGVQAIGAWSDREFVGTGGRLALYGEQQRGEQVEFVADWRSSHYSGLARFTFALHQGLVRQLQIDPI